MAGEKARLRLHSALHRAQWDEARAALKEARSDESVFLATNTMGNIPLYTALGKHAPKDLILDMIHACEKSLLFVDDLGNTSLHWSARFNAPREIIQAIIHKKSTLLDKTNGAGTTPRELLLRKIGEKAVNTMEEEAIQAASKSLRRSESSSFSKPKNLRLHTELYKCQWNGAREALAEAKGDRNVFLTTSSAGQIPLYIAMGKHAPDGLILDLIDSCEESVFVVDDFGNTPAHWSARFNSSLQVVQALIQRKPSLLYQENKSGTTPRELFMRKHGEIFVTAIEKKALSAVSNAEVLRSSQQNAGSTQLHIALQKKLWDKAWKVMKEASDIRKLLMETDALGSNALNIAIRNRAPHDIIVAMVSECEESIFVVDDLGNNCVHWAALSNAPAEVIKTLVQTNPSLLDQNNKSGKTPSDMLRSKSSESGGVALEPTSVHPADIETNLEQEYEHLKVELQEKDKVIAKLHQMLTMEKRKYDAAQADLLMYVKELEGKLTEKNTEIATLRRRSWTRDGDRPSTSKRGSRSRVADFEKERGKKPSRGSKSPSHYESHGHMVQQKGMIRYSREREEECKEANLPVSAAQRKSSEREFLVDESRRRSQDVSSDVYQNRERLPFGEPRSLRDRSMELKHKEKAPSTSISVLRTDLVDRNLQVISPKLSNKEDARRMNGRKLGMLQKAMSEQCLGPDSSPFSLQMKILKSEINFADCGKWQRSGDDETDTLLGGLGVTSERFGRKNMTRHSSGLPTTA